MLPGTHIGCRPGSHREAPETSRRISPIWRFGRFVPVSRARRKGANSRKRAQRAATSFRTPAPDTGRCSTYPGSAPPGPGKAWRRPGTSLHLPSGPMSRDSTPVAISMTVNSRRQNRQTAMLARTRPGPAGARGTPGRALGRCGAIYTKPSYSPLNVALSASCILRLFS